MPSQKELEIAGIRVEGIVTLDERSPGGLLRFVCRSDDQRSPAMKPAVPSRTSEAAPFSNIRIEAEKIVGNQVFLVIQLDELPRISKYFS